MIRTVKRLITHGGKFHPDEVLSSSILCRLYPEAHLIRTRDPEIIFSGESIVYDVGFQYDPDLGMFDHHQKDTPIRPSGLPYSSFGLIWKRFGMSFLEDLGIPQEDRSDVHYRFDQAIVKPVDMIDNGIISPYEGGLTSTLSIGNIITGMNPKFFHFGKKQNGMMMEDHLFFEAKDFAYRTVLSTIDEIYEKVLAKRIISEALSLCEGHLLVLPSPMPFDDVLHEIGDSNILFVGYPRPGGDDGTWVLSAVKAHPLYSDLRLCLPEAWAGLEGLELQGVTGVKDAVFCHKNRFIMVTKSRESMMNLCEMAIRDVSLPKIREMSF